MTITIFLNPLTIALQRHLYDKGWKIPMRELNLDRPNINDQKKEEKKTKPCDILNNTLKKPLKTMVWISYQSHITDIFHTHLFLEEIL